MTREQFGTWLVGILYAELNVLKDTNALADRVLEAARSVPMERPWRPDALYIGDVTAPNGSAVITP